MKINDTTTESKNQNGVNKFKIVNSLKRRSVPNRFRRRQVFCISWLNLRIKFVRLFQATTHLILELMNDRKTGLVATPFCTLWTDAISSENTWLFISTVLSKSSL